MHHPVYLINLHWRAVQYSTCPTVCRLLDRQPSSCTCLTEQDSTKGLCLRHASNLRNGIPYRETTFFQMYVCSLKCNAWCRAQMAAATQPFITPVTRCLPNFNPKHIASTLLAILYTFLVFQTMWCRSTHHGVLVQHCMLHWIHPMHHYIFEKY